MITTEGTWTKNDDALLGDDANAKFTKEIKLSLCNYDIEKFKACMKEKIKALNGTKTTYDFFFHNCKFNTGQLIESCKEIAERS